MRWICLTARTLEFTVPLEKLFEEAYERKKLRYAGPVTQAKQCGWNANMYPIKVGYRGFVVSFPIKMLKDVKHHGLTLDCQNRKRQLKEVAGRSGGRTPAGPPTFNI